MKTYGYNSGFGYAVATFGVAAILLGMQVGTGGTATFEYLKSQEAKRNSCATFVYSRSESDLVETQSSPIENLNRIKVVINPTVTELSKVFNVSRQTIYNWQNEVNEPGPEHGTLLEALAKSADILSDSGVIITKRLLARKLAGGRTFFESIRNGTSAEVAANQLIRLIQKEEEQRERLNARLLGRKPIDTDVQEMGIPHLNEEG